jgi:hypothetical protein
MEEKTEYTGRLKLISWHVEYDLEFLLSIILFALKETPRSYTLGPEKTQEGLGFWEGGYEGPMGDKGS